MAPKRKWQEGQEDALPTIIRAKPGTKAFASGKSVKDALATGSPQAFVSFRQQIVTPYSELPLSINHPTVIILQHYLDISPACDEIFRAWQVGEQTKSEQQVHAAVELLSEIIQVLTPVPFFRSIVIGLVNKVISPSEPYHDHVSDFKDKWAIIDTELRSTISSNLANETMSITVFFCRPYLCLLTLLPRLRCRVDSV